jgi:DNA-binding XRE family transcriptional regulator
MLGWRRDELARAADVAIATIADFETGRRTPHPRTAGALKVALEQAGIRFTEHGVELPPSA